MAKTQYSIRLTYKKAVNEAEVLFGMAKEIDQQKKALYQCRNEISGNWKGDNANLYCSKIIERENELTQISKELQRIAETIKTVAVNTYNAEQKALQIAKERSFTSGGGSGGGGGSAGAR